MALGVDLQVILEVRLSEEDAIAVLVRTAELLRVFVRLKMLREPVLAVEGLVTILNEKIFINIFFSKGHCKC